MKRSLKKVLSAFLTFALLLSLCAVTAFSGQAAGVMRSVYEPTTGLVAPPTVIQTVDTVAKLSALSTSATPPQAAWFTVESDTDMTVILKDGSTSLEDALGFCKGKVIPIIEVKDKEGAELVAIHFLLSGESDAIIASTSTDALLAAHEIGAPYVTFAYIVTGKANKTLAARNAHAAGAHMVVLSDGDREMAEYLQQRFLSVTLRRVDGSSDRNCVGAAVDCGANGVVVNDPAEAYALYKSVTKETYVRRAFIVGHRAYPTAAPENTVEGLRAAYAAGADAVECDVYLTKDNHVVINHNGDISGYTTDANVKGAIESFTRDELKQYTLKAVGSNNKCKFAFLDELFAVLKTKPSKVLVIEIKTGNNKVMDRIKELAKEYGVGNQIVIISFATGHLQYARNLMPEVGLSRLHNGATAEEILNILDDLGCSNSANYGVSKDQVYSLNHRGITSNLWTVDGEANLKTQAAKGAQFLTTNNPNFSEAMEVFFGDMSCKKIFGFEPTAAKAVLTTTKKTTTTTTTTTTKSKTTASTASKTQSSATKSQTTGASATTASTKKTTAMVGDVTTTTTASTTTAATQTSGNTSATSTTTSTVGNTTAATNTTAGTTDKTTEAVNATTTTSASKTSASTTTAATTEATDTVGTTTAADNTPSDTGFDMWWLIPVGIVVLAGATVVIVLIAKRRK